MRRFLTDVAIEIPRTDTTVSAARKVEPIQLTYDRMFDLAANCCCAGSNGNPLNEDPELTRKGGRNKLPFLNGVAYTLRHSYACSSVHSSVGVKRDAIYGETVGNRPE